MLFVVILFTVVAMLVVIAVSIVGFMQHFGVFPIVAFTGDDGEEKKPGGGEVDAFHVKGM